MDIINRIGIQTSKYNNLLLEEEFLFCLHNGVKVFEIFFDGFWPWDITPELRQKIKEIALNNNITLQVHAPIDRTQYWWEVLQETLNFASDMEVKVITLHPRTRDMDMYKDLFNSAGEKGIYIGLENYKEDEYFHSPEDIISIWSHFSNYSNIGITFDVGHANINSDAISFLKSLPPELLLNIHLHDNSGQIDNHLPLGNGNINFPELIYLLKEINYEGNFIIEHWNNNLSSANYFYSLWTQS